MDDLRRISTLQKGNSLRACLEQLTIINSVRYQRTFKYDVNPELFLRTLPCFVLENGRFVATNAFPVLHHVFVYSSKRSL